MGFELAISDDGGGRTGIELRRYRADNLLHGKGNCRRLAKMVPAEVKDNGTTAEVAYGFAEWLSSVVVRPDKDSGEHFFYQVALGQVDHLLEARLHGFLRGDHRALQRRRPLHARDGHGAGARLDRGALTSTSQRRTVF